MQPTVTLVIPNYNGAHHLRPCLDSVAALDYPRERLDVVVVDNASSDDSAAIVEREYSWVRVLRQTQNLGFAEAVNVAARASTSECLALVNNDMRVDPDWLAALAAAYAPDDGCPCVAGVMLDWEGERIDFVEGFVNFHGAAAQARFGEPREVVAVEDGKELLFACGGSMLVNRQLFLELGGFDAAFFAYFEDVDFGWRLWLSGHRVRLAADARSFHRHHSTGSTLPMYQRTLLFERNWLLMLVQNLGRESLDRLLPAALLLLVERALLEADSRRTEFDVGATPGSEEAVVPRHTLARLHAVDDVVRDLDRVLRRRAEVQATRRRSDAEIFRLFGRPFWPVREDTGYLERAAAITRAFRLDELFPQRPATRLVVVDADDTDRMRDLAASAARFVHVVFATERGSAPTGVETVRVRSREGLDEVLVAAEVVVVGAESAREIDGVAGLVVLAAPPTPRPDIVDRADVILCASPEERDGWLAVLGDGPAVVAPDEGSEPAAPLREIVEQPWRWSRRSSLPPTEDVLALLERWRYQYGASRPAFWHLGRAVWRLLPERSRPILRRLLRR
jgi:GT2 family glycosyltransferase